jgi:hypothetical protein
MDMEKPNINPKLKENPKWAEYRRFLFGTQLPYL